MDKLSIVIPAAGQGRRMKSYGPKPLIALDNGETLLSRQLDILHKTHPKAEIVVVVGFEADKVYKTLPPYVKVVENESYEQTNVVGSIALGLRKMKGNRLLIVYGDLVFNAPAINLIYKDSYVVVDTKGQMLDTEVGLFSIDHYATQFAYVLPTKWAHIAYLAGDELAIFKELASNKSYSKLYCFELLNMIIERGGHLKVTEPWDMKITEIDTSKDILRANQMLKDVK